jgi:O-methyltransferase/8-demethyl-8-(2,3-dimethoxy-alpha-L-rhamnosyl)tetracenomycin-C 4'-O-methyltransferase
MAQPTGRPWWRRALRPVLDAIPPVRNHFAEKAALYHSWQQALAERDQVAQARDRIAADLQGQLGAAAEERKSLQQALAAADERSTDLVQTRDKLVGEQREAEATINRLTGVTDALRSQLDQQARQKADLTRQVGELSTQIGRLGQERDEIAQSLAQTRANSADLLARKQQEWSQSLARQQEELRDALARQQEESSGALARQQEESSGALARKQQEWNQTLALQQSEATQVLTETKQLLARKEEEWQQSLARQQTEADERLARQQEEWRQSLVQHQAESSDVLARVREKQAELLARKEEEWQQSLAQQQTEADERLARQQEEWRQSLVQHQAESSDELARVREKQAELLAQRQAEWNQALASKQYELNSVTAQRDWLATERNRYHDIILGKVSSLQADQGILRRHLAPESGGRRAPATDQHARELYLDLLEDALTGMTIRDESIAPTQSGFDAARRELGRDWPKFALTMIGKVRLHGMRDLAENVIADGVPGDFLEAGVWRGGTCIFLRGLLMAKRIADRRVWVADSFAGLPPPSPQLYPADEGDPHHTMTPLAVSLDEVRDNFARYGLLDDQVRFLSGWFKDTLPAAPIERLALLRLDGDMYESTIQTLDAVYWKVSPGGFVVVDDYILPACRKAVDDFRQRHGIRSPLQAVDGAAVYWRRTLAEEKKKAPATPLRRNQRASS